MDKEVEATVLAVINEKRLQSAKRTPVEIISKMGVYDAREKASDQAWLATGDNIIATVWAELVSVSAEGRWYYLELLDPARRLGGGDRSALQAQRGKDRLQLLKRSLDAGQGLRVVLQTNRVAIMQLESDRAAKVSTRVPDDQEWHVALWDTGRKIAVLVRGERGWLPGEADIDAACARIGLASATAATGTASAPADPQAAALDHLAQHFGGYGYQAEVQAGQKLGWDLEVKDKKGRVLLRLVIRALEPGRLLMLDAEEREAAKSMDTWRLAVVSDPGGPTVQHKLYKASELQSAPGFAT